tara:strand:- start:363 stop:626 length:264 start_codon:yes stop_codon:yes gene_type:complete
MSDLETGTTPDAAQFKDWQRSKVTAFVIKELSEIRAARQQEVLNGATIGEKPLVSTEFAVGFLQGISVFLDMKFDDADTKTVSEYGH